MQRMILIMLACLIVCSVHAQKTEFSINLNSGFFSFAGSGAHRTTTMAPSDNAINNAYIANPYGQSPTISYGASGKIALITKKRVMLGFDAGYEVLRSKTKISEVIIYEFNTALGIWKPAERPASGHALLESNYINLYPSAGYRFLRKKITVDVTGGLDLAFCLGTTEWGNAKTNDGHTFTSEQDRKTIGFDLRPRLQVAVQYKKAGVYVGYSLGTMNHREPYVGYNWGLDEARARFIRFGLTYRLK